MRNPFSRPGDLHGLFEDFCFHCFLAQHPLQFADLLERIAQLGGSHHGFTGTDRRQTAVLVQLAPQEQLVGIDAVAPSDDRHTLSWLKALANHGQLLLWAPAAPPLLAQKLPTLVVAIRADSTGRRNTLIEVFMGRPAGWMQKLTGRGAMRSPGAPSLRNEIERLF